MLRYHEVDEKLVIEMDDKCLVVKVRRGRPYSYWVEKLNTSKSHEKQLGLIP
jgi:hypothetical protein